MASCTKRLVQKDSCRLEDKPFPAEFAKDLDELLKDFLDCKEHDIRIAAICGMDDCWSVEDLAKHIVVSGMRSAVPMTSTYQGKLNNASVAVIVVNKNELQQASLLPQFFRAISGALSDTCKHLDLTSQSAIEANSTVIQAVGSINGLLPEFDHDIKQKSKAEYISNLLSDKVDDGSFTIKNGFPRIRILVFLPEQVFAEFEQEGYHFFRQIVCVLHFEDPVALALKEENTALKVENAVLKEENAVLKEENTVLRAENAALKEDCDKRDKVLDVLVDKFSEIGISIEPDKLYSMASTANYDKNPGGKDGLTDREGQEKNDQDKNERINETGHAEEYTDTDDRQKKNDDMDR